MRDAIVDSVTRACICIVPDFDDRIESHMDQIKAMHNSDMKRKAILACIRFRARDPNLIESELYLLYEMHEDIMKRPDAIDTQPDALETLSNQTQMGSSSLERFHSILILLHAIDTMSGSWQQSMSFYTKSTHSYIW